MTENNFEVIIAADNRPLYLLKNEFPKLEFIDKCCHAPMMEHPIIFNKILAPFLKK